MPPRKRESINPHYPRRSKAANLPPAWIATDAEWDQRLPGRWMTSTICNEALTVTYIRDDLDPEVIGQVRDEGDRIGSTVLTLRRTDETNLLADFVRRAGVTQKRINLLVFFSPKDIEYACGWAPLKEALDRKEIRQDSNLGGKLSIPGHTVVIKDLIGLSGKGGLDKFTEGQGLSNPSKHLVHPEEKARMLDVLNGRPREFARYAVDDARIMLRLLPTFVGNIRTIQRECLHMEEQDLWTAGRMPMTWGSLDARTIERWLYASCGVDRRIFQLAIKKVGMLAPDSHKLREHKALFHRTFARYGSVADMASGFAAGDPDLDALLKLKFKHSALDGCSVRWFAERANTDTAIKNALVQGGRCNNENPEVMALGQGNDGDLSGCYGEALRTMLYPVGLPYYWSRTTNQEKAISFGKWLQKWGHDLVPGLWTATVTGDLSFRQDLIFSKLVKPSDIAKAIRSQANQLEEDADIPSDFGLFRYRIVNGIITSDLLEKVRQIAANREWKELMDLELDTAVAYRASDRVEDPARWCEAILGESGEYHTEALSVIEDDRSRAWVAFPLEGFVGAIADRRAICKKLAVEADTPEERARNKGLAETLKLMVNVVYGVMASRHFEVSNTIVANNITAKARIGSWMMAKALNLRQTITDGGIYMPTEVHSFTGKKPGLEGLTDPHHWHNPKLRRHTAPMPGFDWTRPLGEWPEQVVCDEMAMAHVNAFWASYGLRLEFRIEHKRKFLKAAYLGKADYAFTYWNEDKEGGADWDVLYKCRGKRDDDPVRHPIYTILGNLMDGIDAFPASMAWRSRKILKVKTWMRVQASVKGYKGRKKLRPGDDYELSHVAVFNNTHFPLRDDDDLRRRRIRSRIRKGRKVPHFEKYGRLGIAGWHGKMMADRFRDTSYQPRKN